MDTYHVYLFHGLFGAYVLLLVTAGVFDARCSRPAGGRLRQTLDVLGRHGNLSTEPAVLLRVFQFGGLFRLGMKLRPDPRFFGRFPIVVLLGPDGKLLNDERFTVGIEFVTHAGTSTPSGERFSSRTSNCQTVY